MEIPPDSLEDFLTKAARVSAPWCESTSSLPFSICPSRPGDFFLGNFIFFKNSRPIPVESSMSPTPSLQRSCSAECVFVGFVRIDNSKLEIPKCRILFLFFYSGFCFYSFFRKANK